MDFSRWDVMGSKAGFTLMERTLDNIQDVAPATAAGSGVSRPGAGQTAPAQDVAGAFASGIGSLTDASA